MAQPVIIDRNATTLDNLTNATNTYPVPPVYTTGGQLTGISLGAGICRYVTNAGGTGSAANQPILVSKAHRFLRYVGFAAVTTTGIPDATATTINLKREVNNISQNAAAQVTLFSNSGPQAVDTVVFVGGAGWEEDGTKYVINYNISASDTLFSYIYLQYF